MTLLAIGLGIVLVVQILCLMALVDQYKGLLQIREHLGLKDAAADLDVSPRGIRASDAGLPVPFMMEQRVVGLLFSTKCASCYTVAEGFRGKAPGGAWVIITGSEAQCAGFRDRVGLRGERILDDINGEIAERLLIRTFPSALLFNGGVLAAAKAVPSVREMRRVLDDWLAPKESVLLAPGGSADDGH